MIGSPTRQGARQSTAHRDFRRLSTKQYYPPARVQKDLLPGGGLPGGPQSRVTDQGGQIYHRHRYKRAQPYTEPRPAPHNPIAAEEISNGRRARQFSRAIIHARGYYIQFSRVFKKRAMYMLFLRSLKKGTADAKIPRGGGRPNRYQISNERPTPSTARIFA